MNIELSNIEKIANRVVELYRNELDKQGINASGTLYRNTKSRVELNGTQLIVYLNLEDYYKFVEDGRGPGKFPPIDAIEKWIKIKPIIPEPINGRVPDTRQLAFLIARKISREGFEGRKPISNIINSPELQNVIQSIKNEIVRQLKQQLRNGD